MKALKHLGLNMSYTSPFNADFDGDEMNIHVPQDPQSEAEVSRVMSVRACIMGDQTNQNDMGRRKRLSRVGDQFVQASDLTAIAIAATATPPLPRGCDWT